MLHSGRVVGALLMIFAVLPADARDFRTSDVYPMAYPTVQAVVHVDKLVRERSAGRLGITVIGQDDQDSETYTIGEVRNGTLDMARINLAVLNSIAPATVLPALPFLFKSTDAPSTVRSATKFSPASRRRGWSACASMTADPATSTAANGPSAHRPISRA